MRYSLAPLALAALAAAAPQGVTSAISPSTTAPAGCSPNYSGSFEIQVVNVTSSAHSKRQNQDSSSDTALVMTLKGGILKDAKGRTGYIAANRQFQFDGPPQTGAIYTAGWSVCSNGSLAIGGDAIFQQCLSGTFYNLYDEATSAQCSPIYIEVIAGGSSATAAATQSADGQPAASTQAVSQISDAQPQAPTGKPVSQITDGQPQASTGTAKPVSQISDGQIQATTGTAKPVTQISDGQIQASTGTAKPVTQISDGQIQATTGTAHPVTQISDGQVQATTGKPVAQISDGQIQATGGATATRNGTMATATPSVAPYTGAAASNGVAGGLFAIAAGVLALAML